MNLRDLSWSELVTEGTSGFQAWIDRSRKSDSKTQIQALQTRIELQGNHILIRAGGRGSVVVSRLDRDQEFSVDNSDARRKLLSISFDTLTDWHLLLEANTLHVFNNRVSGNSLLRPNVAHMDLPPGELEGVLGTERGYAASRDFQDVSDRLIERIAVLKRRLIGDPDNPNLRDESLLDDILNAALFARFLEDIEKAKKSEVSVDLLDIIKQKPHIKFGKLVSEILVRANLPKNPSLFRRSRLEKLPRSVNEIILEWLRDSRRDNSQGEYEFDMSLIAEHSIGQIYDRYISQVSFITQNGQKSLFPEYETELQWSRGTGLHYTPEFLARFMVRNLLANFPVERWSSLKVADLTCGSGVFLRHYLLNLQRQIELTGGVTPEVLGNLLAIDVNPSALAAAKLSMAMTEYRCTGSFTDNFKPREDDALDISRSTAARLAGIDLILMNPPFKGYEQQSKNERKRAKDVLGNLASGRADYSLAFLKVAFDLIKDNGCIGIIMPATMIHSTSASKVRKMLAENSDIQMVAKFDDYDFFSRGAVQIAIVALRKRTGRHTKIPTTILHCRARPEMALRALETESFDSKFEWELFVSDSSDWGEAWHLVPHQVKSLLVRLRNAHPTLGEMFEIRQGIRIGHKRIFMIEGDHVFPRSEREILKPVVDDDNLYDCKINDDGRRLIYAYESGELISPDTMMCRFPSVLKYLQSSSAQLKSRSRMSDEPEWALQEPRDSRLMFSRKLVSTYFGVRGAYALDLDGLYAVTNGFFLVPKQSFIVDEAWFFYLAILNSDLFFRLLARNSVRLRGRQLRLERKYTNQIAIPDYDRTATSLRKDIANLGRILYRGGAAGANAKNFDASVHRAYGLGIDESSII